MKLKSKPKKKAAKKPARPKVTLPKVFNQWAKGAPRMKVGRSKATVDERIAALEVLVADHQFFRQFFKIVDWVDPSYGHIYGIMVNGARWGFNTDFWMRQNRGKGAAVSLGTDFDRFGIYAEMEGAQVCPDNPTVGLYVANLAQGAQPNHGICTSAGGSPTSLGLVTSPNLLIDAGDGSGRGYLHRMEGVQLLNIPEWYVGHSTADAKRLYP